MATATATKPSLTIKRRLNAPPAKVFAAWTDPEKMKRWMGPHDVAPLRAEIDARVGGRYRFFVRRGKHRTAALVHLGWKSIPVRMRDWWPRLIDAQGVLDWPLVRDGKIAPEFAQAVPARYVENDGTQQRARWRNC